VGSGKCDGTEEGWGGREGGKETVVWLAAGGVQGELRGRLVGEGGKVYRSVVARRVQEELDRLSRVGAAEGGAGCAGGMEGLVQCRLVLLRTCLQALEVS